MGKAKRKARARKTGGGTVAKRKRKKKKKKKKKKMNRRTNKKSLRRRGRKKKHREKKKRKRKNRGEKKKKNRGEKKKKIRRREKKKEDEDRRKKKEEEQREKKEEQKKENVQKKNINTSWQAKPGKKNTKSKKKGITGRMAMWDNMQKKADIEQKSNIFSKDYDAKAHKKLKPGDKGYGEALEGSASLARSIKAKEWVKKQIGLLIGIIKDIGEKGPDGCYFTTFGPLFIAFEKISDTLVGILQRSKKYKVLTFEGEMLFQGQSNNVVIQLTPKADTWEY